VLKQTQQVCFCVQKGQEKSKISEMKLSKSNISNFKSDNEVKND